MLKTKTKTKAETTEPVSDFETARARWQEIEGKHRDLTERLEGMKLALSLSGGEDVKRVPPHLHERAKPFIKMARRRRSRLLANLEDLTDELEDFLPQYCVEKELWDAARRRETNRIAKELQPRHRAAVEAMASALEALSQATMEEQEVRAELRRKAPEPESPHLPNCCADLTCGTLADWNSPASAWARRVRKLGVL